MDFFIFTTVKDGILSLINDYPNTLTYIGSLTVIIEKNSKSIDRCFIFLSTFLLFYIVFFRILCYNIYIFWRSFMRINISKSKNHEFIYIIRDIYNNGSRTTKIHKKLGKIEDLCSEKKYVQR